MLSKPATIPSISKESLQERDFKPCAPTHNSQIISTFTCPGLVSFCPVSSLYLYPAHALASTSISADDVFILNVNILEYSPIDQSSGSTLEIFKSIEKLPRASLESRENISFIAFFTLAVVW